MSEPKKKPKGSPCRNWYVTNVHGRSSAALGSNAKSPYVCSGFIFERKKKMKWKLQRGSVRPSFGAKSSLRSLILAARIDSRAPRAKKRGGWAARAGTSRDRGKRRGPRGAAQPRPERAGGSTRTRRGRRAMRRE